MKNTFFIAIILSQFFSSSYLAQDLLYKISSLDKSIEVNFLPKKYGKSGYLINYQGNRVIDTSYFSFDFECEKPFDEDLEIISTTISSFDETWEIVWGE